jgi:hypothetical protein
MSRCTDVSEHTSMEAPNEPRVCVRTICRDAGGVANDKAFRGVEIEQAIGQFGTEIHSDQNNGGENSTCHLETLMDEGM